VKRAVKQRSKRGLGAVLYSMALWLVGAGFECGGGGGGGGVVVIEVVAPAVGIVNG